MSDENPHEEINPMPFGGVSGTFFPFKRTYRGYTVVATADSSAITNPELPPKES